jgi:hypothetical protein
MTSEEIAMAQLKAVEVMLGACQRRIRNQAWGRLLTSCTWTTSLNNVS